jgi:serine/threonine protein kinase
MSAQEPVSWPQPRVGSEGAALAWLDALVGGICTPETFLNAMHEQFQGNPEEGWEVLSLLDQYYRRGKIKAELFHTLKSRLESSALKGGDMSTNLRPHPSTVTAPAVASAKNAAPTARAAVSPKDAAPPSLAAAAKDPAPASRAAAAKDAASASHAAAAKDTNAPVREEVREVAVGDVLRGRYRVRGVLGHGGMGTVFEAIDEYRLDLPTSGQRIAIKVLHTAVTQRDELLAELQREFQHLQLLSHPHIVRVHEFDRDGDNAFFTMELLIGTLLSRVLGARNAIALPRPYALAVMRDVGAALAHAHSRGVVHGDINPQNIFVTNDGELRVLDFGASHKLLRDKWTALSDLSQRAPFATPGYASCQLLEGQQPDARDDLFAFACVAYLLLSGQHPFPKRTAIDARAQRVRPRRPRGLTGQQWRVLREGLRWDRNRRPADVQKWLDRFGLAAAAPHLPPLPVLMDAPPPRKRGLALAAASIVLCALLAAGGYWVVTNRDSLAAFVMPATPSFTEPPPPSIDQSAPAPRANPAPAPMTPVAPRAAAASVAASPTPTTHTSPTSVSPAPARPTPTPRPAAVTAARSSGSAESARAGSGGPIRIEMAADAVDVQAGERTARVMVRRRGSPYGSASFTWWTESGTAKPGRDFAPVMPRVEHIAERSGSVDLSIPILSTAAGKSKSFYVVIDRTESGAALGARTLTMVTMQPPE